MRKLLLLLLIAFGTMLAMPSQAALIDFDAYTEMQSDAPQDGLLTPPYLNPSGANLKTIDKNNPACWSLDTRMPCYSMASLSGLWTLPLEYP